MSNNDICNRMKESKVLNEIETMKKWMQNNLGYTTEKRAKSVFTYNHCSWNSRGMKQFWRICWRYFHLVLMLEFSKSHSTKDIGKECTLKIACTVCTFSCTFSSIFGYTLILFTMYLHLVFMIAFFEKCKLKNSRQNLGFV